MSKHRPYTLLDLFIRYTPHIHICNKMARLLLVALALGVAAAGFFDGLFGGRGAEPAAAAARHVIADEAVSSIPATPAAAAQAVEVAVDATATYEEVAAPAAVEATPLAAVPDAVPEPAQVPAPAAPAGAATPLAAVPDAVPELAQMPAPAVAAPAMAVLAKTLPPPECPDPDVSGLDIQGLGTPASAPRALAFNAGLFRVDEGSSAALLSATGSGSVSHIVLKAPTHTCRVKAMPGLREWIAVHAEAFNPPVEVHPYSQPPNLNFYGAEGEVLLKVTLMADTATVADLNNFLVAHGVTRYVNPKANATATAFTE